MKNLITSRQIAVVLTGDENIRELKKISQYAGWIELRVDCFMRKYPEKDICVWVKAIRKQVKSNIIGTVRWHKESQNPGFIISDDQRIFLYQAIADYVDCFDVELKSKIAPDVVSLATR
ncbi:MAG TPA: type I 3-dehydroquinate dehydratase, partial [bacterium]|nr:type I 3-dehydroquinate dehydratase [bacterium]